MNQADILKLAESSGLITSQHGGICTRMTGEYITPELTRFAELVAQHERDKLINFFKTTDDYVVGRQYVIESIRTRNKS